MGILMEMYFVIGFLSGAAIAGLTIVARSQDNRAMRDALTRIRWACAAELVASPLTIKIQNLASIGLGDYFYVGTQKNEDGQHGRI